MGIKKFLKDVTGITSLEEKKLRIQLEKAKKAEEDRIKVEQANEAIKQKKAEESRKRKERRQKAAEAKMTPKELATKRKEPWVDAQLNVNQDDVRYGFYEIDWNEYWVLKLKQAGYGVDGDLDEDIIARWLRDISASVAAEEGIDMTNNEVGYINIIKRNDGKSEVS